MALPGAGKGLGRVPSRTGPAARAFGLSAPLACTPSRVLDRSRRLCPCHVRLSLQSPARRWPTDPNHVFLPAVQAASGGSSWRTVAALCGLITSQRPRLRTPSPRGLGFKVCMWGAQGAGRCAVRCSLHPYTAVHEPGAAPHSPSRNSTCIRSGPHEAAACASSGGASPPRHTRARPVPVLRLLRP